MEELFNSLLPNSFNSRATLIDRTKIITEGDSLYWVHVVDQPEWKTQLVREAEPDMPEDFNNVLMYFKDMGMVNISYQWSCIGGAGHKDPHEKGHHDARDQR
jgi:hypothetical protein